MSSQEHDLKTHIGKVEYGVAAVVLLVGIFFIFQAFTIDTSRESVGPRTLPMILAVSLVISGLWLGFQAYRGKTDELKAGYGFLESDSKRIFMVVACGMLFVATFWGFGYFLAVIVTLIAMLLTFGVRNWLAMIIGAIVLAIIFQWVFMGIMLLNDPKGALFDMRPYTNWITGAK